MAAAKHTQHGKAICTVNGWVRRLVGLKALTKRLPALALGLGYTVATSLCLRARRLSTMEPAAHPARLGSAERPSYWSVIGRIWLPGTIVCLQGIGFVAIGAFFVLYFLHRHWSYAGLGLTAFGGGFVLVRVLFGHLPDRIGSLPVTITR